MLSSFSAAETSSIAMLICGSCSRQICRPCAPTCQPCMNSSPTPSGTALAGPRQQTWAPVNAASISPTILQHVMVRAAGKLDQQWHLAWPHDTSLGHEHGMFKPVQSADACAMHRQHRYSMVPGEIPHIQCSNSMQTCS